MRGKTLFFKCLLIASIIFHNGSECLAQQKVQFTQYMFNGLVLNPAFAGTDEALSLTFMNKSQWANVEGAPTTQTFSAHSPIPNKKLGLGITFVNDKIGVHKNQFVQASFAYHLPVTKKSFLSLGLQAGGEFHKSDYASISGNQNIDPQLLNSDLSYQAFNIGAGVFYKSPKFELGISAPSLIPTKYQYYDSITINWTQAQYFAFLRYSIKLNSSLDLQPSLLIKYLKGVPFSYDINMALVIKKVLTLALAYRKDESIDFLMKAKITPKLHLGFGYDYGIGDVSRNSGGSFELMANYVFKNTKSQIASPR